MRHQRVYCHHRRGQHSALQQQRVHNVITWSPAFGPFPCPGQVLAVPELGSMQREPRCAGALTGALNARESPRKPAKAASAISPPTSCPPPAGGSVLFAPPAGKSVAQKIPRASSFRLSAQNFFPLSYKRPWVLQNHQNTSLPSHPHPPTIPPTRGLLSLWSAHSFFRDGSCFFV